MPDAPDWKFVPVEDVHENPWNPNIVPEAIMDALRNNIQRTGFTQPIMVRERGEGGYEIVDGAHRFRAADDLGYEKVPVVVVELSDADAKAQTLAMNKLRGEMEPAEVARLVREIEEEGLSLDELATFTGYSGEELTNLTGLLDFDWDDFGNSTPPPADPTGDDWVGLTYRVPASVAALFTAEVDRLKAIRETEHDHLALEVMAVNSSQATPEEMTGE